MPVSTLPANNAPMKMVIQPGEKKVFTYTLISIHLDEYAFSIRLAISVHAEGEKNQHKQDFTRLSHNKIVIPSIGFDKYEITVLGGSSVSRAVDFFSRKYSHRSCR